MDKIVKVEMKDYYSQRKIIQQLYVRDVAYGDIAGTLLGIREQDPNIESMSLEIQSFRIRIELVQGKNDEENYKILMNVGSILNKISEVINKYILNNVEKITDQDTANEIRNNIFNHILYFDMNHVGNMIEINL